DVVYDVKFFTSSNRSLPQKYITEFTVKALDGDRMIELEAVKNDRNIARMDGVQPAANGDLVIEVRVGADSHSVAEGFGGIGVLELVARDATSTPIPDEDLSHIGINFGTTPNPPAEAGPGNPAG